MKIALAQFSAVAEPAENAELIRARVREAAGQGAELVLFPEASMRGFGHRLDTHAEELDGPFAEHLRETAREAGVTLAAGMFLPGEHRTDQDGNESFAVRNTLFVTDGRGNESAYTKIHLYDAFGFTESDTVDAGEHPVIHEMGGVKIGLALCYDVRFPSLFTHYAREGCQLTLVPASWAPGPGKLDHWRLLAQARALDSTQFILACDQSVPSAAGVDAPEGPTGVGHSMAVSPDGRILAEADDAPALLVVDLDLGAVEKARTQIPVLQNAKEIR